MLDVVRLAMACTVVLLHGWFLSDISLMYSSTFTNGIARTIVPFFLTISGFFFASQTRNGLMPWVRHLGALYLLWSTIFLPYQLLESSHSPAKIIFTFVTGYAHLWYLPALGFGGVMLYALRRKSDRTLLTAAVCLVLTGAIIQWFHNTLFDLEQVPFRNAQEAITRNFLFIGFPYLAIGYVMRRSGFLTSWPTRKLIALLAVACVALIAETWAHWTFIKISGIHNVFASAVLFTPLVFALSLRIKLSLNAPWMSPLATMIYFSHMLVLIPLQNLTELTATPVSLLSLYATIVGSAIYLALKARFSARRARHHPDATQA